MTGAGRDEVAAPLEVTVLSSVDCPHTQSTIELLRATAEDLGVRIDVKMIRISSREEAERLRFPGSPTVRVEGEDIETTVGRHDAWGLV